MANGQQTVHGSTAAIWILHGYQSWFYIIFPGRSEGALLALGDCHAIMGDGEICFTGLEIPAEVVLEVDLIKGKATKWPLVETDQYTMVISGDDLRKLYMRLPLKL